MRGCLRRASLLCAILVVPGATASPLLTAVVPDLPGPGPGDEAFAVGCAPACDLSGWAVGDGEATWRFPSGTRVAGASWFAADADLWASFGMPAPAATWSGPQLANGGDELVLLRPDGTVADAFAWGDGASVDVDGAVTYRSPGLVYRRQPAGTGWLDTDHADDWRTPRTHRVGESMLDAPWWDVDAVTLYSSPDSSFRVLAGLMAEARDRLHLHVYALRHAALADALVAAAERGVHVEVLVTRSPIGLDPDERHETADALRRVQDAGGGVRLAGTGRYDLHHLKVLVADDAVAIQSENWVPSGVPQDPTWGNRGWGIVLHDAEAARWMSDWMAEDRRAWDVEEFVLATFDPAFRPPSRFHPRMGDHDPAPALRLDGPVRVRPVVAPDHTADPAGDPVAALAREARERLWVQQLDLTVGAANDLGWHGADPLAEAIVAAARAGADVRVHVAAPFRPEDTGNAEAVAELSARAPMWTGVLDRPGLVALHNKGLVADDTVVLGSINANHHSRSENREVSVLVADGRAADWYAALFLADTGAGVLPDLFAPGPFAPLFAGLLLAATRRWRSRCGPGSSSR